MVPTLPLRTLVPLNWNVPATVVPVNEVTVMVPESPWKYVVGPALKTPTPAPEEMSKLPTLTAGWINR